MLAPPPPAAKGGWPCWHCVVQVSFQASSGMYARADPSALPLVVLQYVASWPCSLNNVPPIATVNGLDASTLIEIPPTAVVSPRLSHPAAPVSPVETMYVIP